MLMRWQVICRIDHAQRRASSGSSLCGVGAERWGQWRGFRCDDAAGSTRAQPMTHKNSDRQAVMSEPQAHAEPESQQEKPRAATPSEASNAAGQDSGESLDKIRNIIFGAQMRDYDRRFDQLERKLREESARLRDEVFGRLEQLERHVKAEIDTLTERLRLEDAARAEADEALAGELREQGQSFERRVARVEDQDARSTRELREQILAESKGLAAELLRQKSEMTESFERSLAALRATKTDRSQIAGLLAEMAMRLNDEGAAGEDREGA